MRLYQQIVKIFVTLSVLISCYMAIHLARQTLGPRGHLVFDERAAGRALGSPNASLWVVEYMDFQCESCRKTVPVIKEYLEKYPQKIYWQTRFHPLVNAHPYGLKAAMYGECAADQNKFWPFHDAAFETQEAWSRALAPDLILHQVAQGAGMDLEKLDACLDNPVTKERVMKEKDESMSLGVQATPTFFVNGQMMVGAEELRKALEAYFAETAPSKSP